MQGRINGRSQLTLWITVNLAPAALKKEGAGFDTCRLRSGFFAALGVVNSVKAHNCRGTGIGRQGKTRYREAAPRVKNNSHLADLYLDFGVHSDRIDHL